MTSNPVKTLSIHEIAELSGQGFRWLFNIENTNSSFGTIRIFPYNPHIFTDDEFLPALVTDTPFQQENDGEKPSCIPSSGLPAAPHQQDDDNEEPFCVPLTSGLPAATPSTPTSFIASKSGLSAASSKTINTSPTMNNESLLEVISPNPKATVARKCSNWKKCKSAIIKNTPEKEIILSRRKRQPAKKTKKSKFLEAKHNLPSSKSYQRNDQTQLNLLPICTFSIR